MSGPEPLVSVLMPTYRQVAFVSRALAGLLGQTMPDWELVVLDDGSDDGTAEEVASVADPRIRYLRRERNGGLGAALNLATAAARGRWLAYLPSDDYYDPGHLATATTLLAARPEVYAAYAGVRWHATAEGRPLRRLRATPTLRDDIGPGTEHHLLRPRAEEELARLEVRSGNPFALVQVVHRRDREGDVRWTERSEKVSDSLEVDFWRALLAAGCRFAHTGEVSCEWGEHPEQRHKFFGGRGPAPADPTGYGHGLSRYRQHYQVPPGLPLNWSPSVGGLPVDERVRYARLPRPDATAASGGLRILLVGELGFNPERLLALEHRGHRLAGLWIRDPHFFDSAGPLPFGDLQVIPHDRDWPERVRRFRPDVVYALLNWHSVPLVHEVLGVRLGIPLVFHFKESPADAMQMGVWPRLREIMLSADGLVFLAEESRDWFAGVLGVRFRPGRTMLLDGDLPSACWASDDWSPALSDTAGGLHTVCVGRVRMEPIADLARAGIHVHLYSRRHARWAEGWTGDGSAGGHLHVHDAVEPADWVRELSRYDAAWLHTFTSRNGGHVLSAQWDDLNLPARVGTYALAGLPWILRDNTGHRVTVDRLAAELGVGIPYRDPGGLAAALRREVAGRTARTAMRAARLRFTFDAHADRLVEFLRSVPAGVPAAVRPGAPPSA